MQDAYIRGITPQRRQALGTRTHNFGNLVELSGANGPLWNVYSYVYTCVHTLTGFIMDSNLKFD